MALMPKHKIVRKCSFKSLEYRITSRMHVTIETSGAIHNSKVVSQHALYFSKEIIHWQYVF